MPGGVVMDFWIGLAVGSVLGVALAVFGLFLSLRGRTK